MTTEPGSWVPPVTAICIPVREAETIVRRHALAAGSPYQPQDGSTMAHVILLGPFLAESRVDEDAIEELERFFAEQKPFGFELTAIAALAGGPAYLVAEPASLFTDLTADLRRVLPEVGAPGLEVAAPHVTIPATTDLELPELRADLGHRLPIDAAAHVATLVRIADHDTRTLATFPFGPTAA